MWVFLSEKIMQSNYTQTKGVKLLISPNPTDSIPTTVESMLPLEYTAKNLTLTAPSGEEIDVSVLGSPTKETISGLPGEATVSNDANIVIGDQAQDLLRESYQTGDNYAFVLLYTDGSKVSFIARVTNYDMSIPSHGISTGSFSYKVKGFFEFSSNQQNKTKGTK